MTIDLSHISSWIWITGVIVIALVILRFFSHLVAGVFHALIRFFWHGCATAVVLLAVYFILRSLHIL
ncbi:MAG TPA: hypothetical protein VK249_26670 [Anaerolineales bacterium]|nr:hypothetical protein [Anaerolineales bacterium]